MKSVEEEIRRIVDEHLERKPGRTREQDYAEIVRNLLTAYEVGDAVWHLLQEHGPEVLEAILGGS